MNATLRVPIFFLPEPVGAHNFTGQRKRRSALLKDSRSGSVWVIPRFATRRGRDVRKHVRDQGTWRAQNRRMTDFFMRIITRRTLREFVDSRSGQKDQRAVKATLDAWFDEARKARWTNAAAVKRSYATARIVTPERIVLNVKGDAYRLIVAVGFEKGILWIQWAGSRADYDEIDVTEVGYDG
ncbi:MAG: type II toxin-antitoxin system HigB family toxin [Thermoplasmataceae archaeon]